MDISHIKPVLKAGTVFSVTTEKAVNTIEGAPWQMLLKTSRYSVTTQVTGAVPTWWAYTDTKSVVCKKGRTPRLYLLCAIAHGYGFGESSFLPMVEGGAFDETKAMTKAEVSKWLPPAEPFKAEEAMTLPLDSILDLRPLDGPDSETNIVDNANQDYKAIMSLMP